MQIAMNDMLVFCPLVPDSSVHWPSGITSASGPSTLVDHLIQFLTP